MGVLAIAIREEKEVKGIQIGKEVKLSLFADDMILYIKDSKDITRKLLEVINGFSNVARHKTNIQKSVVYSTSKIVYKQNIRKRKKQSHLPFQKKRIKYLISLPIEAKEWCLENYKMLMK